MARRGRRGEVLGAEGRRGAGHARQEPQECFAVEHAAAEERIDEGALRVRALPGTRRRIDADQEMPGKTDAARGNAGALGDLAVDEGQGDGNAETPLEHVRQEAVLRVVVVLFVACESEIFVEVMRQVKSLRRAVEPAEIEPPERSGEVVESREERPDVEVVVDVAGEQGRAERHVEGVVRVLGRAPRT